MRFVASLALLGTALAVQGCAAVGLALFGAGAGTAAGTGIGYTLDSITYKTFTVPLKGVTTATLMALERMDIVLLDDQETKSGRTIRAQAGDRKVEVVLDRLTTRTTRMRVVAKKNWFLQDRATATEVILQTDRTLSDNPQLAVSPVPHAAGTRAKSR